MAAAKLTENWWQWARMLLQCAHMAHPSDQAHNGPRFPDANLVGEQDSAMVRRWFQSSDLVHDGRQPAQLHPSHSRGRETFGRRRFPLLEDKAVGVFLVPGCVTGIREILRPSRNDAVLAPS